jgi:hypothetical protein
MAQHISLEISILGAQVYYDLLESSNRSLCRLDARKED